MSKSPSLRRIQADIRELALDPSDRYHAAPMENDMFEWHFTIRGADQTDFAGGVYHGRILLPPEYPYKPPHIMFLTPTGRFDINTKVCLSFSAFHPELWQPAWGIRLILEALISFLPTPADGAIGALDWTAEERRKLALKSQNFQCPCCGPIVNLLPKLKATTATSPGASSKPSRFQKEIEQLQLLQQQEHQKEPDDVKEKSAEAKAPDEQDQEGDRASTTTNADPDGGGVTDAAPPPPPIDHGGNSPKEGGQQPDEGDHDTTGGPSTVPAEAVTQQPHPAEPPATLQPSPPTDATPRRRRTEQADRAAAIEAPQPPDAAAVAAVAVAAGPQGSGLWDPLLQVTIALLSVICYLLWRKVQALWEELQSLDNK